VNHPVEESAWLDEAPESEFTLSNVRDAIRPLIPFGQGSEDQVSKVLERVAGVSRLKDIPPEKFAATIEAFNEIFQKLSKPRIVFSLATQVTDTFAPLIEALREHGPRFNIMVRAGRIVRAVESERPGLQGSKTQVLELVPLSESALAARLNDHVAFAKKKGTGYVPVDCPQKVASALIGSAHELPEITIKAIAQTPMIIDGQLRAARGFDRDSGTWLDAPVVQVPEICDKAAAQEALNVLKSWIEEFAFKYEADRSVALSAMLTAAVRASIDHAPGFVGSKPEFGAGASTLCNLFNVILTGQKVAAINADKSREEIDKHVDSNLRAAHASLCLDNIPKGTVFNSIAIAQVISESTRNMRILGKTEDINVSCTQLVLLNGVNIRVSEDLGRRCLPIEIDPCMEDPENRTFNRPNLVADAQRERVALLTACYTIILAYLQSGEKVPALPFGGFEQWRRHVQEPLVWLGELDPVTARQRLKQEDPVKAQMRSLFQCWRCLFGDLDVLASEVVAQADPGIADSLDIDEAKQSDRAKAREELSRLLTEIARDRTTGKPGAAQLGVWLRGNKNRVAAGQRIEVASAAHSGGIVRWRLASVSGPATQGPRRDTEVQCDAPDNSAEPVAVTPDSYAAQKKLREIEFDFRSKEDAATFSAALSREGLTPKTIFTEKGVWMVTAEAATPEKKESILNTVFEELGAETDEEEAHANT
jgi:hypothetical protein